MEEQATQNQVADATSTPTPAQAPAVTPPAATQGVETEYPAMTMEDVLASEQTREQEISRGDVVTGTVVFVGAEGIAVDVGAKIEGVIPLSQLGEEPVTIGEPCLGVGVEAGDTTSQQVDVFDGDRSAGQRGTEFGEQVDGFGAFEWLQGLVQRDPGGVSEPRTLTFGTPS